MKLRFQIEPGQLLAGQLFYVRADHSFSFHPEDREEMWSRAGEEDITSLTVDTLQLDVGVETGVMLFAWGYWSMTDWRRTRLVHPPAQTGSVRLENHEELEPGVSIRLNRPGDEWSTDYDPDTDLVKVTVRSRPADSFVTIASGVTLGLGADNIQEIWLAPQFQDTIPSGMSDH